MGLTEIFEFEFAGLPAPAGNPPVADGFADQEKRGTETPFKVTLSIAQNAVAVETAETKFTPSGRASVKVGAVAVDAPLFVTVIV